MILGYSVIPLYKGDNFNQRPLWWCWERHTDTEKSISWIETRQTRHTNILDIIYKLNILDKLDKADILIY